MQHHNPTKAEQIIDRLEVLAESKNRQIAPRVYGTYARILDGYPLEAIDAAILAVAADTSEFFPPVGRIIAEIGHWLRGQSADSAAAPILSAEGAWRLARATVAAYQPQTRPHPSSGNPAVDGALRDLGGVQACQWTDAIGEGIIRRAFLERYDRQCATPGHIRWALAHGPRETPVIYGMEIPDHEIARLSAAAAEQGRGLPDVLAAVRDGTQERAIVLDGQPHAPALPRPLPRPIAPERRQQLREEIKAGIATLAGRYRMPDGREGPPPASAEETHDGARSAE